MKRSSIRAVFSATFLLTLSAGANVDAQGNVRRVPADYPSIQQAINASINGDTVLISPGTYKENLTFLGKSITVTSEAGPQVTIIDGNRVGPTVRFNTGEGPGSILSRLTVQHGDRGLNSDGIGGGISIEQSSPTILNNIITNNTACAGGAGIGVFIGSPMIQGNIISGNVEAGCLGDLGAGGIMILLTSSAQILNNTISNNAFQNGGGILLSDTGDLPLTIRGNMITGNDGGPTGGGIKIEGDLTKVAIVQNLIARNRASLGGGIYIAGTVGEIVNNTIADNLASRGIGIFIAIFDYLTKYHNNIIVAGDLSASIFDCDIGVVPFLEPPVFRNNNFVGAFEHCPTPLGSGGNVNVDPLFVNRSAGDYHLRPGSPLIDAGDNSAPDLPTTDLDGKPRIQDGNGDGIPVVDMGAYEAPASFDICIQDDSNSSILKINSKNGDYQFSNCSGLTLSGTGVLTKRGSTITLQQYSGDRRLLVRIDGAINKASAYIQAQGMTFTITDRNIADDTCACAAH
jgi:hypothetical protein